MTKDVLGKLVRLYCEDVVKKQMKHFTGKLDESFSENNPTPDAIKERIRGLIVSSENTIISELDELFKFQQPYLMKD